MTTILINNIGQLVTVDPTYASPANPLGILKNAAICFEEGRIRWIGSSTEAAQLPFEDPGLVQRMDAQDRVLLPGLIDSHTHTIFAGNRANEFALRLAGKSYLEIAQAGGGILKTVQSTRQASAELLSQLTMARLKRMLTFGVTTVEVKSGYGLDFDTELKCLRVLRGLQAVAPVSVFPTYMGAHDIPPEYQGRTDAFVDFLCNEQLPAVVAEGLAVFCDVFCEAGYFDVAQSRRILEAARDLGFQLKIHAEEFCDLGGAVLAGELGAVSADHLLHISDVGIEAIKQSGTVATLLPGTAFYLRLNDYAPARKLLEAGVPVALATDFNPGSCVIDNLQWIMALACLQMRMSPVEVIQAVTLNAAKALNLQADRGSLALGKRADATLWEVNSYEALLYQLGSNRLTDVFVSGVHQSRLALEAGCMEAERQVALL